MAIRGKAGTAVFVPGYIIFLNVADYFILTLFFIQIFSFCCSYLTQYCQHSWWAEFCPRETLDLPLITSLTSMHQEIHRLYLQNGSQALPIVLSSVIRHCCHACTLADFILCSSTDPHVSPPLPSSPLSSFLPLVSLSTTLPCFCD